MKHVFRFRLKSKPLNNVTAHFSAEGLTFEFCHCDISDTTWDKWAPVHYRTALVVPGVAAGPRTGNVQAILSSALDDQQLLPFTRQAHAAGLIGVWGDPHYTLWDGFKYTRHLLKEFIFYKTDDLEIQGLTASWVGTEASVFRAVTIRYGSSVFVWDLRDGYRELEEISPNVDDVYYELKGQGVYLYFPGGSYVQMGCANGGPKEWYINMNLFIDPAMGPNGGTCNNRLAPAGKLIARNGEELDRSDASINKFYESWIADPSESLLSAKYTQVAPRRKDVFVSCPSTPVLPPVERAKPIALNVYEPTKAAVAAAAAEKARKEALEKAAALEKEKADAEEKEKAEAAKKAAEEKARVEAEENAKAEAAKIAAEEKAKAEAAKVAAEEKARKAEEEKARYEAEEKVKADAAKKAEEEKEKAVAKAKKDADDAAAAAHAKKSAEEAAKKAEELALAKKAAEEKAAYEAECAAEKAAAIKVAEEKAAADAKCAAEKAAAEKATKDAAAKAASDAKAAQDAALAKAAADARAANPYSIPSPPQNDQFDREALKNCKAALKANRCHKLVDTAPYIKDCLADCKITGSYAFLDSYKNTYFAKCYAIVNSMKKDTIAVKEQALAIAKEDGLGQNACPKNCSGRGKCVDYGCACTAGFAGTDCSVALASSLAYDNVKRKYVPLRNVTKSYYNQASNFLQTEQVAPVLESSAAKAVQLASLLLALSL